MSRDTIIDADDYRDELDEFVRTEIEETADYLGPGATEGEIHTAVISSLWESVEATEWFTYSYPVAYGTIIWHNEGGLHRFTDLESHVQGEDERDVLRNLAMACFHFDALQRITEAPDDPTARMD